MKKGLLVSLIITIVIVSIEVFFKYFGLIELESTELALLICGTFFLDGFILTRYELNENNDNKSRTLKTNESWNEDCETVYKRLGLYKLCDNFGIIEAGIICNAAFVLLALIPGAYKYIQKVNDYTITIVFPLIVAFLFVVFFVVPIFKRKRIFKLTIQQALKEYDYSRINPDKCYIKELSDFIHQKGHYIEYNYYDGYKVTDDLEIYGLYKVRNTIYKKCSWIGIIKNSALDRSLTFNYSKSNVSVSTMKNDIIIYIYGNIAR